MREKENKKEKKGEREDAHIFIYTYTRFHGDRSKKVEERKNKRKEARKERRDKKDRI